MLNQVLLSSLKNTVSQLVLDRHVKERQMVFRKLLYFKKNITVLPSLDLDVKRDIWQM